MISMFVRKLRKFKCFVVLFFIIFLLNLLTNNRRKLETESLQFSKLSNDESFLENLDYLKEKSNDRDIFSQCMQNYDSKIKSHPKAPIHLLPKSEDPLHALSASNSICDPKVKNLRVIQILNRIARSDLRNAIRETYGNLSSFKNSSLKGSYTVFFLVGMPSNKTEEQMVLDENEKYNDIIIAKVPEGYYNTSLKILIGLKFASCFCSNAEYFIKIDDDDYLRLKHLDKVIIDEQNALNSRLKLQNEKQTRAEKYALPARLYMGGCGSNKVQRPDPDKKIKNSWQLTLQEYSENSYPPYCGGPFYMFSMGSVIDLARDCPYTCIGLDPKKAEENEEKPCLWKFEDTFVGSCVWFTRRNDTTLINIQYRSAVMTGNKYYRDRNDPEMHLTVHGVRKYSHMIDAHQFYLDRKLVY